MDSGEENALHSAITNNFLRTAIKLSADHYEAIDLNDLTNLQRPLLRYLIRAGTRSTPFGAFASVNAVNLMEGESTSIQINNEHLRIHHTDANKTQKQIFKLRSILHSIKPGSKSQPTVLRG